MQVSLVDPLQALAVQQAQYGHADQVVRLVVRIVLSATPVLEHVVEQVLQMHLLGRLELVLAMALVAELVQFLAFVVPQKGLEQLLRYSLPSFVHPMLQ